MIKILAIATITLFLSACNGVPPYDGLAHEELAKNNQHFDYFYHDIDGQTVHGAMVGENTNPALIFIHGTPGDWKAWGQYLGDPDLNEELFIMAFDRPGFGGSDGGTPVLNLKDQGDAIIKTALKEHPGPFILIGHSYGGPVQVQIAQDHADHVAAMIILAGALDPVTQKARWYHYLANTWIAWRILPEPLKVTTKEMIALPPQLEAQQERLRDITISTTLIQGETDWLVPKANVDYAKMNIDSDHLNTITLDKQGHFLPWEQYDLVKSTIIEKASEN